MALRSLINRLNSKWGYAGIAAVAALSVGAWMTLSGPHGGLYQTHSAGHHGADGSGHDEQTMPGLRGANATDAESAEIAVLFRKFESINRTVTNLPNGIRTETSTKDPEAMEALVSHVTGMIARVENADDPQIIIQSPTLDIFFAQGDDIITDIEVTEDGIAVIQTSDNADVVAALHIHAEEVTQMVDRGMAAVHDMMMQRAETN